MIPPGLDHLRRSFPSESAIDGLVRIGQMGARLGEMKADWLYLWLLTVVYFGLAVVATWRRISRDAVRSASREKAHRHLRGAGAACRARG
jgi:ABC-2 type transport system permease protein